MRTIPITSDRNDPRYQEKTLWSREVISRPGTDDNGNEVTFFGNYDRADTGNFVRFETDDFQVHGDNVVISEQSKKECIEEILKEEYGRNVNFV